MFLSSSEKKPLFPSSKRHKKNIMRDSLLLHFVSHLLVHLVFDCARVRVVQKLVANIFTLNSSKCESELKKYPAVF